MELPNFNLYGAEIEIVEIIYLQVSYIWVWEIKVNLVDFGKKCHHLNLQEEARNMEHSRRTHGRLILLKFLLGLILLSMISTCLESVRTLMLYNIAIGVNANGCCCEHNEGS